MTEQQRIKSVGINSVGVKGQMEVNSIRRLLSPGISAELLGSMICGTLAGVMYRRNSDVDWKRKRSEESPDLILDKFCEQSAKSLT